MEIVIDIPEETYEALVINQYCGSKSNLENIIINGTSLPKNHGRLIDADAYKSEINRIFPCQNADDKNIRRATEIGIDNAPTIIEGSDAE